MDTKALLREYRGRLAFWRELSTQRTLPFGFPDDVRKETRELIEMGREGGILSPSHAEEVNVCLENILAFVDVTKVQLENGGIS